MIGKRSGTERALIGTDQRGAPVILATDGAWVGRDCEEVSTNAEDVGLVDVGDCREPGLYLWEGYGEVVNDGACDGPLEPTVKYTGTLRPVRPGEVAGLYAMAPPEVCCVCGEPATAHYADREDLPSCGRATCELQMQTGLDFTDERGG